MSINVIHIRFLLILLSGKSAFIFLKSNLKRSLLTLRKFALYKQSCHTNRWDHIEPVTDLYF